MELQILLQMLRATQSQIAKYAGRRLNQNLSTSTPRGETIRWQVIAAITSFKRTRVVMQRTQGKHQAGFKFSCMTVKRTIFWKKLKSLISPKSSFCFASRRKHTWEQKGVFYICRSQWNKHFFTDMTVENIRRIPFILQLWMSGKCVALTKGLWAHKAAAF